MIKLFYFVPVPHFSDCHMHTTTKTRLMLSNRDSVHNRGLALKSWLKVACPAALCDIPHGLATFLLSLLAIVKDSPHRAPKML